MDEIRLSDRHGLANFSVRLMDITIFNHFVSFIIAPGAACIAVQYRTDDVWQDEGGAWQMKPGATPFHVARSPAPPENRRVLSPNLEEALIAVVLAGVQRESRD